MQTIPFTAVHYLSLRKVLRDDKDAHDPISATPVGELNHPVQIGRWDSGRFVPSTNNIFELEDLRTWMLQEYKPGDPVRSTNPMTREELSWQDVDPVQWIDPPRHLKAKPYVNDSTFYIGLNRDLPLPKYFASQKKSLDQDFQESNSPERVAFRQGMAWLTFLQGCPFWVAEYWRHHVYSIQDAEAHVNWPNWRIINIQMPLLTEYQVFRIYMAQMLMSDIAFIREVINDYWKYHPYNQDKDDAEVLSHYNHYKAMQGTTYGKG